MTFRGRFLLRLQHSAIGFSKQLATTLSDPMNPEIGTYWKQIRQTGMLWYPSLRQTCREISRCAAYYEFVGRGVESRC
ncbi:MAG: hypothetical protein HYY32_01300 [Chloroflexi bacterium]|nr:hypothetical protein [Chloroflexota bacterium]